MTFPKMNFFLISIGFSLIRLYQNLNVSLNSNDVESMLQRSKKLKADEFVVWRVQNSRPVYLETHEYNNLSEDPHIILERLRVNDIEWNLCYWIPKLAEPRRENHPVVDVNYAVAAGYTMILDQILNENTYHHYSRRAKYETSDRVIGMFDTCLSGGIMRKFNLKTQIKYFILLEKENYVHTIQDFPMNRILQADYCAILYSTNVFVFCGNVNITDRLRNMTRTLGHLVMEEVQKYDPNVRYIEIEYRRTILELSEQEINDAVTFYRAINYSNVTPYNLPDLGNQPQRRNLMISRAWESRVLLTVSGVNQEDMRWLTSYDKGPLHKSLLKANKCYVLITRGQYCLNFFLWLGKNTSIKDKISASTNVENVVWSFSVGIERHFFSGTVHVIEDGKESLEFKANFVDWFDEDNIVYGQKLQRSMVQERHIAATNV